MIDLASKESALLAVLYDKNKKLLSYGYCLEQDNTLHFYQHTTTFEQMYRTFSLGKVLIYRLLEFAIIRGYKKFDFMTGPTSYKYEWTKEAQVIYEVIGSKNLLNYCKYWVIKVKYFLQFNFYTRKFLKFVWHKLEKHIGNT